jgi:hypothetical protein
MGLWVVKLLLPNLRASRGIALQVEEPSTLAVELRDGSNMHGPDHTRCAIFSWQEALLSWDEAILPCGGCPSRRVAGRFARLIV